MAQALSHKGMPKFRHGCNGCRFLGQTIGGMHISDLYVCDTRGPNASPTLVARYGDGDSEYLSIDANYAHATGHSELFAAAHLWRQEEREP